jgi:hypothetical protein
MKRLERLERSAAVERLEPIPLPVIAIDDLLANR